MIGAGATRPPARRSAATWLVASLESASLTSDRGLGARLFGASSGVLAAAALRVLLRAHEYGREVARVYFEIGMAQAGVELAGGAGGARAQCGAGAAAAQWRDGHGAPAHRDAGGFVGRNHGVVGAPKADGGHGRVEPVVLLGRFAALAGNRPGVAVVKIQLDAAGRGIGGVVLVQLDGELRLGAHGDEGVVDHADVDIPVLAGGDLVTLAHLCAGLQGTARAVGGDQLGGAGHEDHAARAGHLLRLRSDGEEAQAQEQRRPHKRIALWKTGRGGRFA